MLTTLQTISTIIPLFHQSCESSREIFPWQLLLPIITSLLLALINLKLFQLNKKSFSIIYSKPQVEILDISVKPRRHDDHGGQVGGCYININLYNPSSFGNHVKIGFKYKNKFVKLVESGFLPLIQSEYSKFYELGPFGRAPVLIFLFEEEALKLKGKKITIIIQDIRKQENKLNFLLIDKVEIRD